MAGGWGAKWVWLWEDGRTEVGILSVILYDGSAGVTIGGPRIMTCESSTLSK